MTQSSQHAASSPLLAEQLAALRALQQPAGQGDAARDKEELLAMVRGWLGGERQKIKEAFLADNNAPVMLAAHSAVVDTLLGALFGFALQGRMPPIALAAIGGYGRAELFPHSDIDLLFLYDPKYESEAAHIAEFVLYMLWDLGFKIGQAHRTVDEAIQLAREDMTIRTTLLDARFIAGHKALCDQLHARFKKEVVALTMLEFVDAKLAERDARHRRFGDSRYMLEPNVKEGKGGLRDLHTLWWMASYAYPIKQLADLVPMKLLDEGEYRAFDQARLYLWRVRIHLHYQAGRAEERVTFDRQQALAEAMGFRHPSVNRSIERFMRRYFVAVRTVGSTTRIFCALLEEDKKRKPRKALGWLWHAPWKLGGFRLDGERLSVRNEQAFEHHPVLMIEIFRVAQLHGLDIHPRTLQLMARHLKRINGDLQRDPRAIALFMEILLSDKDAEITLRRMSDAGVFGRFIPDFGRIIGQTQFNMYHVYTVDEHTLVALGILHALEQEKLRDELPLSTQIIKRIQMRRVLYLALLCHDIAKGQGGDHSELGERIAAKLAVRFGFKPDEVETAAWLVRYHLLFSHTAFRRDIDDPKTVQDFVRLVQTPERLKLLLVLTAADIRAVGPGVWNAWKGALLRELYQRAEQYMSTGSLVFKKQEAGQLRQEMAKLLPGWPEQEIDAYLDQGNPVFLAGFDAPRHAVIARMLKESKQLSLPLMIDTQHDYGRVITEITVVTADQHGLFSMLAGALALAGANISNAKIFTLKNGMAVDVFQLQDAAGQVFDRSDRLAKMSVFIEQSLSKEIDLGQSFAKRAAHSIRTKRDAVSLPGQVFIDNNASNICSVVEISGRDRIGFLYRVTHAIAELGLSIATAHISTYGTQVADVFYVKDIFGMKVTHEAKLKQVQEMLLKTINQ